MKYQHHVSILTFLICKSFLFLAFIHTLFPVTGIFRSSLNSAILQKYLDNFDLSIKVIYIFGTLGFTVGQLIANNKENYSGFVAIVLWTIKGIVSV